MGNYKPNQVVQVDVKREDPEWTDHDDQHIFPHLVVTQAAMLDWAMGGYAPIFLFNDR